MKLSIITPCYNEADMIEEFHKAISDTLKENKISYELIMVDDGSIDITYEKIKELCENDKNVKGISFSRNFGKESAMLAGLKFAEGDYIAIMDADLQHSPSKLLEMYNKLLEDDNYDVVCAYRQDRKDEAALKRTLTAMYYKINNKLSDIKLLPGASDFRVFKKRVKDAILLMDEKDRYLKGIFSWIGFNTIYVPYKPDERLHGTSKWSIIKLSKYAIGGMISFSTKPLKSIFILGLITFIISLLNFILMGELGSKTIILFLGFLLLSIGIISLYIIKIYNNVLRRPDYIIKHKIGFKN